MRGKSTSPTRARFAAGTHWSKDPLGVPPNNLARCVLTPSSGGRRKLRMNFPLYTYSVFGEENVSRGNENNFAMLKKRVLCP